MLTKEKEKQKAWEEFLDGSDVFAPLLDWSD